jgi:membrane protease YdiL (CAAX protease family)
MSAPPLATPRALLLPYALPYLLYAGLAAVFDARTQPEWLYGGRVVLVGAALVWARRFWRPLTGPKSALGSVAVGALAGLVGAALWIGLVLPFAPAAEPWPDGAWTARALVATIFAPLVEEPLMRGYVLWLVLLHEHARRAGAKAPLAEALDRGSFAGIRPGEWSPLALGVSSAVFAAGHAPHEWPAAAAYGLLLGALWIARGDLVSCLGAHAVTNAALAVWVRATGTWAAW